MEFNQAFDELIGHEGTLSLDPDDRGNWTGGKVGVGELKGTKYGVSAAQYPHLDIKNLTVDHAKDIYLTDYWFRHNIHQLPDAVRFDIFDAVVNSGPGNRHRGGGVVWAQRAANVTMDGIVGAQTIAAIRSMDPYQFLIRFNSYRLEFIAESKVWASQGRGLVKRIARNMRRES